LQYHEDYQDALQSYEKAIELDPDYDDARNNQDSLLSYLRTVTDLIACKGRLKPKRFKSLISVLNETKCNDNVVPLDFLCNGENDTVIYRGTVVASLGIQDVKLMFILADTEEKCVLVTVYYVDITSSVSLGDIIEIPKPFYRLINIEWKKEKFSIQSIRVDTPKSLKLNGKDWPLNKYAAPNMSHLEEEFEKIEREHGWSALFHKLATEHGIRTLEKKNDIALMNTNRALNRFRDVLPYDDTRVRLNNGPIDYINASFINVPLANRRYILTQGPLPTTSKHFWQMIWEQNTCVIVMLTKLMEKGCNKCWLYYPDYSNDSELIYNDVGLKVTFVSEKPGPCYTQRKFELTNMRTDEVRCIIHWHYTDWPDHGAPDSAQPFLEFLMAVRHSGAFDSRYGAPVLHCSAGIGRSGTFVLVDSILVMLAHTDNPEEISLIEVLAQIRLQRHGLIQTNEQLRFSYLAIVEGLKILDELEESHAQFLDEPDNMSSSLESSSEEDYNYGYKKQQLNRAHNIMPSSKLSDSLEDINTELIRRLDSNASIFTPRTVRTSSTIPSTSTSDYNQNNGKFFSSIATPSTADYTKTTSPLVDITTKDSNNDTSLRLRTERLKRNEIIEKKVQDIKEKLRQNEQQPVKKLTNSIFTLFSSKNRRPLLIYGIVSLLTLTGTIFFYKFYYNGSGDSSGSITTREK
ncbi:unnamed protein product, partial [Didymodactylos carnosus]